MAATSRRLQGTNHPEITYTVNETKAFAGGGFGKVFEAKRTVNGKDEAIAAKRIDNNPDVARYTDRELSFVGVLKHEYIVETYDYALTDTATYIFMERCDGSLLGKNVTLDQIPTILAQILSSLAYLHRHNIAHRDIKRENCLFKGTGDNLVIKLCDFGLSKLSKANENQTVGIGTKSYLAPEVEFDATRSSDKSDIWALGCTVHQLLTNREFIEPQGVWHTICHNKVVSPELLTLAKGKNEKAGDLLARMLTYDPAQRITVKEAQKHEYVVNTFNALELARLQRYIKTIELPPVPRTAQISQMSAIYSVKLDDPSSKTQHNFVDNSVDSGADARLPQPQPPQSDPQAIRHSVDLLRSSRIISECAKFKAQAAGLQAQVINMDKALQDNAAELAALKETETTLKAQLKAVQDDKVSTKAADDAALAAMNKRIADLEAKLERTQRDFTKADVDLKRKEKELQVSEAAFQEKLEKQVAEALSQANTTLGQEAVALQLKVDALKLENKDLESSTEQKLAKKDDDIKEWVRAFNAKSDELQKIKAESAVAVAAGQENAATAKSHVLFHRNKQSQYYMVYNQEKNKEQVWVFWQAGTTRPEVIATLGDYFVAVLNDSIDENQTQKAHDYNIFGIAPGQKYIKVKATPLQALTKK